MLQLLVWPLDGSVRPCELQREGFVPASGQASLSVMLLIHVEHWSLKRRVNTERARPQLL